MQHKSKFFKFNQISGMMVYLSIILIVTIGAMVYYQINRKDPVTIHFKSAEGYLTTEVVHKNPNETIGEVLEKANTPDESIDYVCTLDLNQKINTISDITVYEKVNGNIVIDDQVIPYESGAKTVKEVLEENNIAISPVDIVSPGLDSNITRDNSTITISRVATNTESNSEVVPYETEYIDRDDMPYNETEVVQAGVNGIRSYTEQVNYENGVEIERFITSDQRTVPVNEILYRGTNLTIGVPNIKKGDIESWRPYVIKALEENGLSTEDYLVEKVLRQINTESAGDQTAHQEIFDINSIIGQEARGLMQTTPYTFEHYHHEGYDDILNGYHNLLAALNYAKEAYGPNLNGLGEGHGY